MVPLFLCGGPSRDLESVVENRPCTFPESDPLSDTVKRDLLVFIFMNYPDRISGSLPWPDVAFAEALRDLLPS